MVNTVLIRVKTKTKKMLESLKVHPRQSFDEVLNKLIGEGDKLETAVKEEE